MLGNQNYVLFRFGFECNVVRDFVFTNNTLYTCIFFKNRLVVFMNEFFCSASFLWSLGHPRRSKIPAQTLSFASQSEKNDTLPTPAIGWRTQSGCHNHQWLKPSGVKAKQIVKHDRVPFLTSKTQNVYEKTCHTDPDSWWTNNILFVANIQNYTFVHIQTLQKNIRIRFH